VQINDERLCIYMHTNVNAKNLMNYLTEGVKNQLHKDRLRALLLFPEMKEMLENAIVKDVKRHTYRKNGENRLMRFRLQLESAGNVYNFTSFHYKMGDTTVHEKWNVNGKISRYSGEFSGRSFKEVFGVNDLGEGFVSAFLSALDVEEMSQIVKEINKKERTA